MSLPLLSAVAVLAATIGCSIPSAGAAPGDTLTGTIVAYGTGAPVAGATVKATASPGSETGTTATATDGSFVLTGLGISGATSFKVKVTAPQFQSGWATRSGFVDPAASDTFGPDEDLGVLKMLSAVVRGRVVDAVLRTPVAGASVRLLNAVQGELARTTTGVDGVFVFRGVHGDEFGLKVRGAPVGYEIGYWTCTHKIVPTWGGACTFAPGNIGMVMLDKA